MPMPKTREIFQEECVTNKTKLSCINPKLLLPWMTSMMQNKIFKILPQLIEKGEEKAPKESFYHRIALKDSIETSNIKLDP